ncbi:MAG: PilZ domain-containing protein [Deltaproteobacteria bacterium]
MDTEISRKSHQYSIVEARYPVRMLTDEGTRLGEAHAISAYGAIIRCQRPLRLNEIATISIELSGERYLRTEAEAVWLEYNGQDGHNKSSPRGMVVRFKNLSTFDKQFLRDIINKHYLRKSHPFAEEEQGAF